MEIPEDVKAKLELWKQYESARYNKILQQSKSELLSKIKRDWSNTQNQISKEWLAQEAAIVKEFSAIEECISDLQAAMKTKQANQSILKDLREKAEAANSVKVDDTREQRVAHINQLKIEIKSLEESISKAQTELRTAEESKKRYKRLFLRASEDIKSYKH